MSVASVARRAGRSRWVERGARLGFAARGVLYGSLAVLALEIPLGLRDSPPEGQGALSIVADRPLGGVLLPVVAAGFAGLAVWRLSQAVLDRDGDGTGARALARRGVCLAGGLFYAALAAAGAALAAGWHAGSQDEDRNAAVLLGLPFGRLLVGAIGAAILGAGLFNAYSSLTARFRREIREERLAREARGWVVALGVAGHAARAVIFALVGAFLLRAAIQYDAEEAAGLDETLRKLIEQPYGEAIVAAVAAGLLAYALFCFAQARYGRG